MTRTPIRLLVLLVAGAVLAACGGTKATGTSGFVSHDPSIASVDIDKRVKLPVLSGEGIDGKHLSTSDFEGKVMVVNLWASWCAPCRKEAPMMASVSKKYANKNVQFVGILSNDSAANANAFNDSHGIDYPSFVNRDGSLQLEFAKSLPALSIPVTWVVDARGRVAARILGGVPTEITLSDLIAYAEKTSE